MSLSEISAQASEEKAPATSLWRTLPLAMVIVCGLAFSGAAALVVRKQERERFVEDFDRQAQIQCSAMRVVIREYGGLKFSGSRRWLYPLRGPPSCAFASWPSE